MKATNLVGMTFGHLKVIAKAEKDSSKRNCYLCKCVCGNEKVIRGSSLSYGITIACGCMVGKYKNNYNRNSKRKLQDTIFMRDLNMSLIPYYGA